MRELNLAQNELDDTALQAIMNYVKKDVCMERLLIQGNNIRVRADTTLDNTCHD